MNILFIGYGMLGDHIVCLRSLELLKEKYPQSIITYVGNPTMVEIGVHYGNNIIDKVLNIESCQLKAYTDNQAYHSVFWDAVFEESNLIINHKMDSNGYFSKNIRSKGFRWIRKKEPEIKIDATSKILLQDEVKDKSRNAYAQVGELIELIGLTTKSWQSSLVVNKEKKEESLNHIFKVFTKNNKRLIAFHPGSSMKEKNYSLEKWGKVINNLLSEIDAKLLIFVGPNEKKQIKEITNCFSEESYMIIQKSLIESISFLSICDIFLGHDTGFAHIAASLKLPSVLLFGPASSKIWKPPIRKTRIILSDDLSKLEPYEITSFIKNENIL